MSTDLEGNALARAQPNPYTYEIASTMGPRCFYAMIALLNPRYALTPVKADGRPTQVASITQREATHITARGLRCSMSLRCSSYGASAGHAADNEVAQIRHRKAHNQCSNSPL